MSVEAVQGPAEVRKSSVLDKSVETEEEKMRIIKCDRCGKEIPDTQEQVGYVEINLRDIGTGDFIDENPFENWDLCDDCLREIHECITMPPGKKAKFEEIIESVDAGKKTKETTKKKKTFPGSGPSIDVGKAQVLRDAGWSVANIAAELKTTETTVYKWTHAPEPKKKKPLEWAESEPYIGPEDKTALDGKYREGAEE